MNRSAKLGTSKFKGLSAAQAQLSPAGLLPRDLVAHVLLFADAAGWLHTYARVCKSWRSAVLAPTTFTQLCAAWKLQPASGSSVSARAHFFASTLKLCVTDVRTLLWGFDGFAASQHACLSSTTVLSPAFPSDRRIAWDSLRLRFPYASVRAGGPTFVVDLRSAGCAAAPFLFEGQQLVGSTARGERVLSLTKSGEIEVSQIKMHHDPAGNRWFVLVSPVLMSPSPTPSCVRDR